MAGPHQVHEQQSASLPGPTSHKPQCVAPLIWHILLHSFRVPLDRLPWTFTTVEDFRCAKEHHQIQPVLNRIPLKGTLHTKHTGCEAHKETPGTCLPIEPNGWMFHPIPGTSLCGEPAAISLNTMIESRT